MSHAIHNKPSIERPLSLKKVSWDETVQRSTIRSAFFTFSYILPTLQNTNEIFQRALKKAFEYERYFHIPLEYYDSEVDNHFRTVNVSSFIISRLPRKSSLNYILFYDKVSPVVIAQFRNGLFLLDGNHRSVCCGLSHTPIKAIFFDFCNLEQPSLKF